MDRSNGRNKEITLESPVFLISVVGASRRSMVGILVTPPVNFVPLVSDFFKTLVAS